jgi:adenosylcobinamide-GDP ribazoletransferase
MKTLKLTLSFLTALPFPSIGLVSDKEMSRTIAFFPLVGLIVGGVNFALYLFGLKFWSPAVAAWLWLISNALITGGLHLDGWIDTFDALGSRKSRSEMLAIMKDSRIGAMGGIAAVLLLGFKWSLLTESNTVMALLVLAPVVGRSAVLIATRIFKYIREQGLGHVFTQPLPLVFWLLALATISVIFFLLAGLRELVAAAFAVILSMLWARFLSGKFGGLTGDNYGAINELAEILFLFLAASGFIM